MSNNAAKEFLKSILDLSDSAAGSNEERNVAAKMIGGMIADHVMDEVPNDPEQKAAALEAIELVEILVTRPKAVDFMTSVLSVTTQVLKESLK